MSFSWWARLEKAPTTGWVARAFGSTAVSSIRSQDDLRADSGGRPFIMREPNQRDELTARLEDVMLDLYIPGDSAAGVEVSWSPGSGLRVRCFSQSNSADHRLAAAGVQRLTQQGALRFVDDDEVAIETTGLESVYDDELCSMQNAAGRATVLHRLEGQQPDGWVLIQSPVRPLFVSSKLIEWLDADGTSLHEYLRQLVALHHEPGLCPRKRTFTVDAETVSGEYYEVGQRTLLVDPFEGGRVLVGSPGQQLLLGVDWETLTEVLGDDADWLDGHQLVAPQFEAEDSVRRFRQLSERAITRFMTEA